MKIAIIGAGSIGKRHLANLRALGHESVVIDTRSSARNWARGEGYQARDAAARDSLTGVSAAVIATPAPSHLYWLRECVERHLPALVEKPLGIVADLPALRELRPAAPVMIGYQLRFHPEVQRIRPLLSKAAAALLTCWCDSRKWPGSAGEGDFIGEFSHEVDLALHLGERPVVSDVLVNMHDIRFSVGSFVISLRNRASEYIRRWEIFDQPHGSYDVQFDSPEELGDQMYIDELAHFLRAVKGGPIAPGCTLEEGIAVLEIVRQVKEFGMEQMEGTR